MPSRVEAIKIDDQQIYIMGKITGDIVSTIGGIVQTVFGIGEIIGGIGLGIGGTTLTGTGAGAIVGVPILVVSGAAVAQGTAITTSGVALFKSSLDNLGKDLG